MRLQSVHQNWRSQVKLDVLLCSESSVASCTGESSSDPAPKNVSIKVFSNLVPPSLDWATAHLTLWGAKVLDFLPLNFYSHHSLMLTTY